MMNVELPIPWTWPIGSVLLEVRHGQNWCEETYKDGKEVLDGLATRWHENRQKAGGRVLTEFGVFLL